MALISGTEAGKWDPSTDAQPMNWTGLLYFSTDTGKLWRWSGSVWVDVTGSLLGGSSLKFFAFQTPAIVAPSAVISLGVGTLKFGSVFTIQGRVDTEGTAQSWILQLNGTTLVGFGNANQPINYVGIFDVTFTVNNIVGGNYQMVYQGHQSVFPGSVPGNGAYNNIANGVSIATSSNPTFTLSQTGNGGIPSQVGPMTVVLNP
jgi:hypothetical protein